MDNYRFREFIARGIIVEVNASLFIAKLLQRYYAGFNNVSVLSL